MAQRHMSREQQRLARLAQPDLDWSMAPETMDRYLLYRLYLVEHQIDGIIRSLERNNVAPYPAHLEDRSMPEDVWASWASLNYLLRARDNLRSALAHSNQS
ncbi:MAG: hypothetical protein GXX94_01835 [Chloroflexi bacterium]|nr:hypothetical protein [Chloroflexota bacterium]